MDPDFDKRVEEVVERIVETSRDQARADVAMLRSAGMDSEEALFKIVEDRAGDPKVQSTAFWLMSRLGVSGVTPALFRALEHEDAGLRATAARAIGEIGIEESTSRLVHVLRNDKEPEVRKAAAYALGQVADRASAEPLVQALRSRAEHPDVRGMVAEALANVGDPSALPPLIDALDDPSTEVRFWAAFALGQLGDQSAVPALRNLAATDSGSTTSYGSVKEEAEQAIQRILEHEEDPEAE